MDYLVIIVCIFLAGLLGGTGNYLLALSIEKDATIKVNEIPLNDASKWFWNRELVKSIILGVVASFMVPLFLEIGQSNLISNINGLTVSDVQNTVE